MTPNQSSKKYSYEDFIARENKHQEEFLLRHTGLDYNYLDSGKKQTVKREKNSPLNTLRRQYDLLS